MEVTCLRLPHLRQRRYRPETRLVHSGTLRSQFGETSEALFLTQGFVYDSAEQCEARFKGEDPGFLYSRFSNPNDLDVRTPHDRARRRRSRARHRHRHGRGDHRHAGAAEGRRSRGGGEGDVRLVPLCGGRSAAALRHCRPRWSTASISTMAEGDAAEHQKPVSWRARPTRRSTCSTSARLPRSRIRRRAADRRQCVRDPDLAKPADARRRRRGLFRDQAYRRPGPLPRRHHSVLGGVHRRAHPQLHAPDRPVDVAVQRLGAAEGAGDAGGPRPRADRNRRRDRRRAGAASEDLAADLSRPRRSSAGRPGEEADARRLDPGRLRGQGRQGGGVPLRSTR